eukprot:Pgem_evm1s19808
MSYLPTIADLTNKNFTAPINESIFKYNDQVDRHNRRRQDTLDIEKNLEVKEWKMRVISSLLAIGLAKELIYNNYDKVHTRSSSNVFEAEQRSEAVGTPTLLPSK